MEYSIRIDFRVKKGKKVWFEFLKKLFDFDIVDVFPSDYKLKAKLGNGVIIGLNEIVIGYDEKEKEKYDLYNVVIKGENKQFKEIEAVQRELDEWIRSIGGE